MRENAPLVTDICTTGKVLTLEFSSMARMLTGACMDSQQCGRFGGKSNSPRRSGQNLVYKISARVCLLLADIGCM